VVTEHKGKAVRTVGVIGSLLLVVGLSVMAPATSNADGSAAGSTPAKIAFSRIGAKQGVYTARPDGSHLKRLTRRLDPTYFGTRYNPDWHPNGKKLVFAASRRGLPDRLYRINADGSGRTRLTYPSQVGDSNPEYSPSGHRIALQHDSWERGNLRRVDADGSNRIRLTSRPSFEAHWAPDGSKIVLKALVRRDFQIKS
jgi:Tol biopolymer transport system component